MLLTDTCLRGHLCKRNQKTILMKIEQIYTGCLAHGAYYIESAGEAAIIDPLREVQPYLDMAEKRGATIKYIFETHFHADFVSGHIDLSKKTGAPIVYGPTTMETGFDKLVAEDGQIFELGDVKIKLLHTPGHTLESSCYLLYDEQGKEHSIFTGDTLFIGDVGRPDLAQKVIKELTQDKLAGYLYDSLRSKILPLPDHIVVYPGHGAGSACGKMMSSETTDTLGHQKKTNYALDPGLTKEEFKKAILEGLTPPPGYFPQNVMMNIKGYESIDKVLKRGDRPLSPAEFEAAANETDALLLDARDYRHFAREFVPNSINISLDGNFAPWVGTLIPSVEQPLLIITEEERLQEVLTRLARVGYDNVIGYLKGGVEAWEKAGFETDSIESISAGEAQSRLAAGAKILDVRKKSEYDSEHVEDAINAPLDYLNDSMKLVDPQSTYLVHCKSGYRSMSFISALRARGYHNLIDVKGGFDAIKKSGNYHLTDYVAPTTLL